TGAVTGEKMPFTAAATGVSLADGRPTSSSGRRPNGNSGTAAAAGAPVSDGAPREAEPSAGIAADGPRRTAPATAPAEARRGRARARRARRRNASSRAGYQDAPPPVES